MATLSPSRVAGWASRRLTEELNAHARSGDWEAALATFAQAEHSGQLMHHNVFHFTTVIKACARAGQINTAMSMYARMKAKHVKPNVFTYTALITACGQAREGEAHHADTALRFFAEMRLAEVPPNVHTLTALITACAKAGKWERCIKMIDEAEELFIAPNVFTYTAAMDGCRRAGVVRPTIRLLQNMHAVHQVRPNAITYNTVLGACLAAKDYRAALPVYAQMVADGYQPLTYTKNILVELFEGTPLEGSADVLCVRERLHRRELYIPDSDPATAIRALGSVE